MQARLHAGPIPAPPPFSFLPFPATTLRMIAVLKASEGRTCSSVSDCSLSFAFFRSLSFSFWYVLSLPGLQRLWLHNFPWKKTICSFCSLWLFSVLFFCSFIVSTPSMTVYLIENFPEDKNTFGYLLRKVNKAFHLHFFILCWPL